MTSHGYTITGDNYFFLNFYQLPNLRTAKAGIGRELEFPDFYVAQYVWFHYLEMCRMLRKNAVLMKARGLGFSEMNASLAENMYTVHDHSVTIIAAFAEKKLTATLSKVWSGLSFLNSKTDDGFSQLAQVVNNAYERRASYLEYRNGIKSEDGSMAVIRGIVTDTPDKLRGDRCDLLIYEESGSWPKLTTVFTQGDALVAILGQQFGIKIAGGTGGDKGGNLEGLRTLYYNPETFNILPYRHSYTATGDTVLTGFFLPAFSIVNGCIDSRGYSDEEAGKAYYEKERAKYISTPKELLEHSAEYCFTAEEAFNLEGDNNFNKVNIAEQLTTIRALKKCPPIEKGFIEFTYKDNIHDKEHITGFKWIQKEDGPIKILEHPLWTL